MSTPDSPTEEPSTSKPISPSAIRLSTHVAISAASVHLDVQSVLKKESIPEKDRPEQDIPLVAIIFDGEPEEVLYKVVRNAAITIAAAEVGTANVEALQARAEELFTFLFATRQVLRRTDKREAVYNAVDGERDYQDSLPPSRTELQANQTRTTGEYLTMMRHYMAKADEAWTLHAGDAHALDVIRKIAGIAVHCMEDNGIVQRKVPTEQPTS